LFWSDCGSSFFWPIGVITLIRPVALAAVLALGASASTDGSVEPPVRPHKTIRHSAGHLRLAVDVVRLKSGAALRGAIVHSAADGSLTIAVSREWLHKTNPVLFKRGTSGETAVRKRALEELRDRLNRELGHVPEDSRLAAFLRSERKRVERLLSDAVPPAEAQFLWLEITKHDLAKAAPALAENRRIAGWSWYERLANVETRDAAGLEQDLRQRGIDPAQALPDLSDRFPLRLQSEDEWAARLALVEYALDKPLDFQGTGGRLVRVDRGANPKNVAALVPKLFAGQVEATLNDLLSGHPANTATARSPESWLKTAYEEANGEKARAFRATRVDLDPTARQTTVMSVFAIRLKNGDWKTIWSDRESRDASKERPAPETAISDDPQVKSALASLKSLGPVAEDQVRQAIRFGAATMEAQQVVDRRFVAFGSPFLLHLDGPPLW
jgi:hypothetical protein